MKQTYYRNSVLNHSITAETSVIKHLVLETYGVHPSLFTTANLKRLTDDLCSQLDLNVINSFGHQFSPYGDTLLYLLEESHLALHSWPENGYLHFDFVTCQLFYPDLGVINRLLQEYLSPSKVKIYKMRY